VGYDIFYILMEKTPFTAYFLGAQILRELGVKSLRLLTNNPDKVYQLSEFGLEISERVPIQMTATAHDLFYLKTKQARMGHILEY